MSGEIIKVAEIWARNVPNSKRVTLDIEKVSNGYYYLTSKGYRSSFYETLDIAKADIVNLWGNWIDFKLLIN